MEYDPLPDPQHRPSAPSQTSPARADASRRENLPHFDEPPAGDEVESRRRRRLLVWLVVPLVALFISAFVGVLVGASIKKPEVDTLADFVPRLVTELRDRDGQVFQTYARENRILLDETDLPKVLQNAILAAEDSNFFLHGGIDLKGIVRAAYKNLRQGRKAEGASTITMQLARELFLSRDKKWTRKINEAFLAVELEKRYSKQQILTLYCNLVNLGQGNYGMEAAARNYFNKSVAELSIAEAATLAGIPQRPSYYNVHERPDAVKRRRDLVLSRMLDEELITEEEYESAVAEPLIVVPLRREETLGLYFSEEVRRYLAATFGTTGLYDRGLQVDTTLDHDMQIAAESTLRRQLVYLDHLRGWRGPKEHFDDGDLESRQLPSWRDEPPELDAWYEGIVLESDARKARVKIGDAVYELGREGIAWTRRQQPRSLLEAGDVAWFRFAVPEGDEEAAVDDWVLHLE